MTPQERLNSFLQQPVFTRSACQVLTDFTALQSLLDLVYSDGMAAGRKVREGVNPFQQKMAAPDRFEYLEHTDDK